MPIFDLECRVCGWTAADVLLSVRDDVAQKECPFCHKKRLVKKPCRVHARFYGEGFYKPNLKDPK